MSEPKPIHVNEPISFEDWKAGVALRRAISEAASPGPARRKEGGGADRRLRAAFKGKRAPSREDLASVISRAAAGKSETPLDSLQPDTP